MDANKFKVFHKFKELSQQKFRKTFTCATSTLNRTKNPAPGTAPGPRSPYECRSS